MQSGRYSQSELTFGREDSAAASSKPYEIDEPARIYFTPTWCSIAREVASVADLEMRMQGIILLGACSSSSLRMQPKAAACRTNKLYEGVEKCACGSISANGVSSVVQDNLTCVKRGYSEMKAGIPPDVMNAVVRSERRQYTSGREQH